MPNSDADYLRRLAGAHRRRAALYPQITYAGETELAVAARLEIIAEEIDVDTNTNDGEPL